MTRGKALYCKTKKAVRFTTGVFGLIAAFCAAWLQLGFPVPATAEDVRKLSRGQAHIGIKVQLEAEKDLRREISDLEWKLIQVEAQKNKGKMNGDYKKHLTQRLSELRAQLDIERSQRNAYKEQLQKLEIK